MTARLTIAVGFLVGVILATCAIVLMFWLGAVSWAEQPLGRATTGGSPPFANFIYVSRLGERVVVEVPNNGAVTWDTLAVSDNLQPEGWSLSGFYYSFAHYQPPPF